MKNYYSTAEWFPKQMPCAVIDGKFVPVENLETVNIEEDISGRDLVTFKWKGQERQSFVVLKYV
jgi:hypothetical protein